ncbi:MAG: tRNA guanosine(34) transglycosylase Tgt [Myxococcales bacterium]|nr:tRNA guanosine(34) transglycosylase Tgt [Myxococcales bacterium]MCB9731612.1 tRNA guanosine(34) transglycosylase Tgt [Deltaproteobacteria bacterium]
MNPAPPRSGARFGFELLTTDAGGTEARRGRVTTAHGVVETPVFMPVGTLGTVKALTPAHLLEIGAEIILGNTYHLYLRPGLEVVEALGGLHRMAAWSRPILTDSGGFQVFSLRDSARIKESGVTFRSHLDGSAHELSPERAIAIQETLGSDIMMAFDECPPASASPAAMRAAVERTTRWAKRCIAARTREDNALFGIVQGGTDRALRERSLADLVDLPFDGLALGGLSVGESRELTWSTVAALAPQLPADRPRYLMGVGTPEDLLVCIGHGVDMFDCVLPTRNARNARVMTPEGDLNLRNTRHRLDDRPIDESCACYTCRTFTRGYLRHLHKAQEILFSTLASLHNLAYLIALVGGARAAIEAGDYASYRDELLARRRSGLG